MLKKTVTRRIVYITTAAASLVISAIILLGWVAINRMNEHSAMECVLEWGRLKPFPSSAQVSKIELRGSMFTREFEVSFAAPAQDIETWIHQSPGTNEAQMTTPSPGIRHFQIAPGGGADFAEVRVEDRTGKVWVRVYWS